MQEKLSGLEVSFMEIWERREFAIPIALRNSLGRDSAFQVTSREMSISDKVDTMYQEHENLCTVADGTRKSCSTTSRSLNSSSMTRTDEELVEVTTDNCCDVDTVDSLPAQLPIHVVAEESDFLASHSKSISPAVNSRASPKGNKPRLRLTLSAFRRPELTVRLTDSDPTRYLENEYDLRSPECGVLGHGAFSTVRLAIRRSDQAKVAVKSIAKHEALRARRLRRGGRNHLDEWEILRLMHDHPNIITLLDVFETDEDLHLVMEYCEGGELFDAIQKKRNRKTAAVRRGQYSEPQAACITSQILTALRDLHAKNIVHRDVKPENILLVSHCDNDIQAKLCDFGIARLFRDGQKSKKVAVMSPSTSTSSACSSDGEASPITPGEARTLGASSHLDHYAAPEAYSAKTYHTAADIYSLGVTVYILLCGFPPVFQETDDGLQFVVFPDAQWKWISERAKVLIRKMLSPDRAKRITAHNALQDEWIVENLKQDAPTLPPIQRPSVLEVVATIPASPTVNLELVRRRLLKTLCHEGKDLSVVSAIRKRVRRRSFDWDPRTASSATLTPRKRRSTFNIKSTSRKRSFSESLNGRTHDSSAACVVADLYRVACDAETIGSNTSNTDSCAIKEETDCGITCVPNKKRKVSAPVTPVPAVSV